MKRTLEIKDLSVGYEKDQPLIKGLNASLSHGAAVALIGRNGGGKSTLIKCICGLKKPVRGEILLDGRNLYSMDSGERAQHVSVVLTDREQIGNIKVNELIRFGRYPFTSHLGIESVHDKALVDEAIKLCGINYLLNKNLGELSDGERQKVMLARCIAQDTDVICLDEPTSHLDLVNRSEVYSLMNELRESKGVLFIFSTHDLHFALNNASDIWLLNNQEVITGTPDEFRDGRYISSAFGVNQSELDL